MWNNFGWIRLVNQSNGRLTQDYVPLGLGERVRPYDGNRLRRLNWTRASLRRPRTNLKDTMSLVLNKRRNVSVPSWFKGTTITISKYHIMTLVFRVYSREEVSQDRAWKRGFKLRYIESRTRRVFPHATDGTSVTDRVVYGIRNSSSHRRICQVRLAFKSGASRARRNARKRWYERRLTLRLCLCLCLVHILLCTNPFTSCLKNPLDNTAMSSFGALCPASWP